MDVRRLLTPSLGLLTVIVLAACNALPAASSPPQSASPGVSASSPAKASPSAAPSPSSSSPSASVVSFEDSGVTSAAQAAALVFASDPLFGYIRPQAAGAVGQSASYTATESGDGYAVSITMGSGDCQSSCINSHTWNYHVDPHGQITLQSEQGDPAEVSIDRGTGEAATVTVRLVAGPVCPVEKSSPEPSCAPRPVPAAEVVLRDPYGQEVARGNADASGGVSFFVPGGAYYVEGAAVEGLMRQAEPVAFSVPGGRAVTVTLTYDTGIR